MTRKFRLVAIGAAIALMFGLGLTAVDAAGLFGTYPPAGGSQFPTTVPLTGNETLPADTNLLAGQNPASEAISTAQLAAFVGGAGNFGRNYLDNGDMSVNQQGTATITGGTTTITALQFAADRWFVDTNVGSGAGQAAVITASPAPPAGFVQSVKMWRNSGALLQPVCMIQEIETARARQLQGQNVVFSISMQALAGFTAANGQVQAYIITGTGTDQGLATLTATPAITPAWTGLAGGTTANATFVVPVTNAAWTRYYTPPALIPAAALEVGVEVCFTPVGSSSGATDGIAMTGAQLEVVASGSTTAPVAPSAFEFKPIQVSLLQAQRFFFQLNEPASGAATILMCGNVASGSQICPFALPAQMRGTTPVVVIPTTGTFKLNISGTTPTTWTTPAAGTCSTTACTVTASTADATIGSISGLNGGGGSGVIYVKNDVVM